MAITAISFASVFIRWSSAPPEVIAAYRMMFAALILMPFALRRSNRTEMAMMERKQWWLLLMVGVVLAFHFFTFNAALEQTSVTSATVLVTCHPIVVGILGYIYLKERPRRSGLGIVVGLLGVFVIASADLGKGELNGDILAILGMLAAAVYLLSGRVLRQGIGVITYAFLVYSVAAVVLFAIAIGAGSPLWPYPVEEIAIFLALALVSTIFGHTILNWSLKYLPAAFVSVSMLGEPVGASILAYLLLSEAPSVGEAIGGTMVLAGILLTAGAELGSSPRRDTTPGQ